MMPAGSTLARLPVLGIVFHGAEEDGFSPENWASVAKGILAVR